MICEDILLAIDQTLDQLIRNAEVVQNGDLSHLSDVEIDAFQKTQESLLHRLIHMDEKLAQQKTSAVYHKTEKKRSQFKRLKATYQNRLSLAQVKHKLTLKRKKKKII